VAPGEAERLPLFAGGALDLVLLSTEVFIISAMDSEIASRENDCFGACGFDMLGQGVGIVSLIGDDSLR
jgi:hypothetical protein